MASIWGPIEDNVDEKFCFVLMPFDSTDRSGIPLSEIYESCIKKSVRSLGLECTRADEVISTGEFIKDVWRQINRAAVIIAELTYSNPNVLYELGIAHTLGKRVVLIVQENKKVPSNIQGLRRISYKPSFAGLETLAEDLKRTVNGIIVERKKQIKRPPLDEGAINTLVWECKRKKHLSLEDTIQEMRQYGLDKSYDEWIGRLYSKS